MAESSLLVDRPSAEVARLRLDRPQRRNAIDEALVDELAAALDGARDARAVVIASSTPDCFCAGADLRVSDDERARVSAKLYALYETLLAHPAIVVASIDGPAVGGGAQLAIASDLRVVSGGARFRFVGPEHGLAVGAWGLPSLVGRGHAIRLCLTGDWVDADAAMRIGLADHRADGDSAADAAVDLALRIAQLDPAAVRTVKRIVVAGVGLGAALRAEAAANGAWSGTTGSR